MSSIRLDKENLSTQNDLIHKRISTIITTSFNLLATQDLETLIVRWTNELTSYLSQNNKQNRLEGIRVAAYSFTEIIKHYAELLKKSDSAIRNFFNIYQNNSLTKEEFLLFSKLFFFIALNMAGTTKQEATRRLEEFIRSCSLSELKQLRTSIEEIGDIINSNEFSGIINGRAIASIEFMKYILELKEIPLKRIQDLYHAIIQKQSDEAVTNQFKIAHETLDSEKFTALITDLAENGIKNAHVSKIINKYL